jgi:epoxyqueuosine reductase
MADTLRETLLSLAAAEGFEVAGIAAALPSPDAPAYQDWAARGLAGRMTYLSDHRAAVRDDPRRLLEPARSLLCVGKVYNGPEPYSTAWQEPELGWIARYAWGEDYHTVLRDGLERVAQAFRAYTPFEYRICVDTAPLLERSYARQAGLGWIGRNTCLINQQLGSWLFLGEMLLSLDLEPGMPPPDRCGSCRRCIDACPTRALVPINGRWELDARLCIAYFTIELRDAIPEDQRDAMGHHVFGCDICQDVCPWNRKAAVHREPRFARQAPPADLERLSLLSEGEFKALFRHTPVERARYRGFLRNVAVAMGNSGLAKFEAPLRRLADHADPLVAEHARWALHRLRQQPSRPTMEAG